MDSVIKQNPASSMELTFATNVLNTWQAYSTYDAAKQS